MEIDIAINWYGSKYCKWVAVAVAENGNEYPLFESCSVYGGKSEQEVKQIGRDMIMEAFEHVKQ